MKLKLFEEFAAVGVAPEGNVGGMGDVKAPTSGVEGSGDAWPSLGTPSAGFSYTRKKKKKKKMKHVNTFESFINEGAVFKRKDYEKTLIMYAIDKKAGEIYVVSVDKVKNSIFPELSPIPDKRFHVMWSYMLEDEWLKQYDKLPKVGDILPAPKSE